MTLPSLSLKARHGLAVDAWYTNEMTLDFSLFLQILAIVAFCFLVWKIVRQPVEHASLRSVAILVLGDIGRSPRMMYHSESFAENGFETYIIGNKGTYLPALGLHSIACHGDIISI